MNGVDILNASKGGHLEVVRTLLADPRTNVNAQTKDGYTALILASDKGHLEVLRALLADPRTSEAMVNAQTKYGYTALTLASDKGRLEVVQALLADPRISEATVNAQNKYGYTALILASREGHAEVVSALLADPRISEATVNAQNKDGYTALTLTSLRGRLEVVQSLLADQRTNVNAQNKDGDTSLILASDKGRLEVVQALLADQRTNVNAQNKGGDTALILTSKRGHIEVVRALLADPRTNVNAQNKGGHTALTLTSHEGGRAEVVRALLADPRIVIRLDYTIEDIGSVALGVLKKESEFGYDSATTAYIKEYYKWYVDDSGYKAVNFFLRGTYSPKEYSEHAGSVVRKYIPASTYPLGDFYRVFDSLIANVSKMPKLTDALTVVRCTTRVNMNKALNKLLLGKDDDGSENYSAWTGKSYEERSFLSTSSKMHTGFCNTNYKGGGGAYVADAIMKGSGGGRRRRNPYLWVFKLSAGVKCLWIQNIYPEYEILLPPYTTVHIKSIEEDAYKIRRSGPPGNGIPYTVITCEVGVADQKQYGNLEDLISDNITMYSKYIEGGGVSNLIPPDELRRLKIKLEESKAVKTIVLPSSCECALPAGARHHKPCKRCQKCIISANKTRLCCEGCAPPRKKK